MWKLSCGTTVEGICWGGVATVNYGWWEYKRFGGFVCVCVGAGLAGWVGGGGMGVKSEQMFEEQ